MRQHGLRWMALGLVFTAVGMQAENYGTTACKSSSSVLVYIGTYGQLQPAGFSPAGTPPPDATFDKTQGIYATCLDTKTGNLKMLGVASDVNRSSSLLADPARPILYSVGLPGQDIRAEGNIFSFTIAPASGILQSIDKVGSGGGDPTDLAIEEKSHTLFVANHSGGKVTALPLRPDGGLDAVISSQTQVGSGPNPRQSASQPHGVAVDPTGRYLMAADFGADRLFIYHFDPATRTLSPASPAFEVLAPGSGPRHLTFHPNGRLAFLITELSAEILSYKWDAATGHLQPAQTTPLYPSTYSGTKSGSGILVSRDGRFLYASLRGDQDSVIVFKVDPQQGTLTELQRLPTGGKAPWDFAIDPTGRWLLIANVASNTVSVLKIDPKTGLLTATDHPLSMLQPDSIAFIPNR
jgi:6-phosphogluconolactonase